MDKAVPSFSFAKPPAEEFRLAELAQRGNRFCGSHARSASRGAAARGRIEA